MAGVRRFAAVLGLVLLAGQPAQAEQVDLAAFGARPDDGVADGDALRRAVEALRPGDVLSGAPGTYDIRQAVEITRLGPGIALDFSGMRFVGHETVIGPMIRFRARPHSATGIRFRLTGGTYDLRRVPNSRVVPNVRRYGIANLPPGGQRAAATAAAISVLGAYRDAERRFYPRFQSVEIRDVEVIGIDPGEPFFRSGGDSHVHVDSVPEITVAGSRFEGSRDSAIYISRGGAGGFVRVEDNVATEAYGLVAFKRGTDNVTMRGNRGTGLVLAMNALPTRQHEDPLAERYRILDNRLEFRWMGFRVKMARDFLFRGNVLEAVPGPIPSNVSVAYRFDDAEGVVIDGDSLSMQVPELRSRLTFMVARDSAVDVRESVTTPFD